MQPKRQGISNRETADKEATERDELARPEGAERDAAGHVAQQPVPEQLEEEVNARENAHRDGRSPEQKPRKDGR